MEQNEENEQIAITFQAIFSRATTLVDGSWRVSFDVSPKQAEHLFKLSTLSSRYLQVAVVPLPKEGLKRG